MHNAKNFIVPKEIDGTGSDNYLVKRINKQLTQIQLHSSLKKDRDTLQPKDDYKPSFY
ncbi:MAG: hypothetical protein A4E52_01128 [Pelotomaculum sp. PtaB.Bin013]|nr:MAG: hypothetical protein A4E52_01128 [Pelotomaculum sp. PtaB.Bin013]